MDTDWSLGSSSLQMPVKTPYPIQEKRGDGLILFSAHGVLIGRIWTITQKPTDKPRWSFFLLHPDLRALGVLIPGDNR